MVDNRFANAKKILDWYMEKCDEAETTEAQFALQYAHLHVARYKSTCILDSLHAYPIDTSTK